MEIFSRNLDYVDPEKVFLSFKNKKFFFWLDSTLTFYGRYSIIGFHPFLIFKSKKDKITIETFNSKRGNPFDYLMETLEKYRVNSNSFFIPGAVGYLGYDAGWYIEQLPDLKPDFLKIPDIFFCFYEFFLIFDIKQKKLNLAGINIYEKEKIFKKKMDLIIGEIKKNINKKKKKEVVEIRRISSNIKFSEYVNSIEKIKDYIKKGDVYQINFSHRFQVDGIFPSSEIYPKIRKINPAPYSAYYNFGDFEILSNSPEDKENLLNLLNSEKDRAELIMIVDLERNDIGKICEFGSVKVKKLVEIERYKTVFQTTSTIEGIFKNSMGPVEVIKAMFPGGSITGAPKKRAMEIIEELEPEKRSYYTGCLGYIGFNQNMLFNILIRTLLIKKNKLYYPVGGGIVWDSKPEREYEETITKAKNLFITLGIENVGNLLT